MAGHEHRTTKTTLERLPDPVRAAALERAESALLTVPPDAPAFLTESRARRRAGLLARLTGPGDSHASRHVAFVIAPRDILVVTHGEGRGTAVLTARLEDLELGSLVAGLRERGLDVPDADGMDVTGFPASGPDGGRGSFHIGLGPPAGDEARAALEAAIRAAKA